MGKKCCKRQSKPHQTHPALDRTGKGIRAGLEVEEALSDYGITGKGKKYP
jgi:hypothetical protein